MKADYFSEHWEDENGNPAGRVLDARTQRRIEQKTEGTHQEDA